MLKGAPPGSQGSATPSGWSNEEIFVDYLQHFIHYVKPSPDEPVVMILDNHGSHISIPAITCAKTSGIIMISIPPHTSHKMQPLDKTVLTLSRANIPNLLVSGWRLQAIMESPSPFMM